MDFEENQNIGTMEVLERHQFDEKALTDFEIGFEVGFSTSAVKVRGMNDNHEATMATANTPYFSAKEFIL